MPTEATEHIFDRYYQTEATIQLGIGSGLGLSISKEIVTGHNGEISVTSTPDKGTTFTVTLPV